MMLVITIFCSILLICLAASLMGFLGIAMFKALACLSIPTSGIFRHFVLLPVYLLALPLFIPYIFVGLLFAFKEAIHDAFVGQRMNNDEFVDYIDRKIYFLNPCTYIKET